MPILFLPANCTSFNEIAPSLVIIHKYDFPSEIILPGVAVMEGTVGEGHATLGTVRGGTGAALCDASGGAERSEASEPPSLPDGNSLTGVTGSAE